MNNATTTIRPIEYEKDIARIIDIWYEGSVKAHSFIDSAYWANARTAMETDYIPKSKTWVMLLGERIIGFYSIFEDNLAAIFVDPIFQGKGYGRTLLKHAFEQRQKLRLHVYQKNESAVRFYQTNGFKIESETVDKNTGEKEYIMLWTPSADNIELVDYCSEWPKKAAAEIAHLRKILPGENILEYEHVGGTAVPGLIAKPIIDIQIAVKSLEIAKEELIKPLEADHYAYWYDNPDQDRMFFVKGLPPIGQGRTHHVHIVGMACPQWLDKILFRDYLIAHPDIAQEYAALKRELAGLHTQDREKYTDAKTEFIMRILDLAR
jgi:GrpB-like predicted nucleotidyltransferase (UPF0157 family)/ribosomal protein S18 acetylase RimI-like enzyme